MRRLLRAGAPPAWRHPNRGRTPLHRAARRGYAAAVGLLLAAGADAGAADRGGGTPLHHAAIGGHAAVCGA